MLNTVGFTDPTTAHAEKNNGLATKEAETIENQWLYCKTIPSNPATAQPRSQGLNLSYSLIGFPSKETENIEHNKNMVLL